jgi:hypothetical protein
MILTATNLDDYFTCEQRFRLCYGEGIYSRFEGNALWMGRVVHKALEIKGKTGSLADAKEYIEDEAQKRWNYISQVETAGYTTADDVAIAESVVKGMVRHAPWVVTEPEEEFLLPKDEVPIPGCALDIAGKIDGVWYPNGKKHLLDYKTATRLDSFGQMDALSMAIQPNLYTAAYNILHEDEEPAVGFTYAILRKPQIKQRKTEDLHSFCMRIEDDYRNRPDFYFHDISFELTKEDSDLFWEDFLESHGRIVKLVADKLCPNGTASPPERNRTSCNSPIKGMCPYYAVCRRGLSPSQSGLAVYGSDYHPELEFTKERKDG